MVGLLKYRLGCYLGPRGLPLDRFWRHVSYIFLVNDVTNGGNAEEVLFKSIKPSFICHGYWRMAHMHHDGWSIGSKYRGYVFRMTFCFE